jgi:MFS family permease
VHSFPALLAVVCVGSFGVAVVRPCVTTLITKSVGRHEQGAALGTGQSLSSISQMVGQPMAGLLIEHHLLWAYGMAAGGFALLGALLSLSSPEPAAADGVVGST